MSAAIDPSAVTGIVLAGGRGTRMGGVDKGLQLHRGVPLAQHAMQRLGRQVGRVAVNANRNLAAYASFGAPVWSDRVADTAVDFAGPLAGFLSALERCETPYLATVPCDSPDFPADLVARLGSALLAQDADIAMAATRDREGRVRAEPVFCLMQAAVRHELARCLETGERKVERWAAGLRRADVLFDDVDAFANANTADELQRLQLRHA